MRLKKCLGLQLSDSYITIKFFAQKLSVNKRWEKQDAGKDEVLRGEFSV
jgi:hypothetical protein